MELSGIRGSYGNLFQYINERDWNNNGRIEPEEIYSDEFNMLDIDHNGQIYNSEIMRAANSTNSPRVRRFSAREQSQVRRAERQRIDTQIRLVNPETIFGVRFNRGAIINFGKGEILLSANTLIDANVFGARTRVRFNNYGHIRSATLATDTLINGIRFKAGTIVVFYNNGSVRYGTLAEDIITIDGWFLRAERVVYFNENGRAIDF
jgi:uncharacterized protein YuzE